MSRVLITGGTGFLGAWVAKTAVEDGWLVRVLDLEPKPENLNFIKQGLAQDVEIIAADVCDQTALGEALDDCDAVIHLAGLMTVECAADPVRGISVNLKGSQNVFSAAIDQGIDRVIYASTGAVYGPASSTRPNPMSLYGVLKLAVEGIARVAHQDHNLKSTGFRPYIVYGPGESAGIAAGPSIALRQAVLGGSAEIRFSGSVGFVHVTDVAIAMVKALRSPSTHAEIFDLAGEYADVKTFVNKLRAAVPDVDITLSGAPLKMPQTLSGGESDPWFDALSITTIEDGIHQSLAHWQAFQMNAEEGRGANDGQV